MLSVEVIEDENTCEIALVDKFIYIDGDLFHKGKDVFVIFRTLKKSVI